MEEPEVRRLGGGWVFGNLSPAPLEATRGSKAPAGSRGLTSKGRLVSAGLGRPYPQHQQELSRGQDESTWKASDCKQPIVPGPGVGLDGAHCLAKDGAGRPLLETAGPAWISPPKPSCPKS